jgi:hypothetical protein
MDLPYTYNIKKSVHLMIWKTFQLTKILGYVHLILKMCIQMYHNKT